MLKRLIRTVSWLSEKVDVAVSVQRSRGQIVLLWTAGIAVSGLAFFPTGLDGWTGNNCTGDRGDRE